MMRVMRRAAEEASLAIPRHVRGNAWSKERAMQPRERKRRCRETGIGVGGWGWLAAAATEIDESECGFV